MNQIEKEKYVFFITIFLIDFTLFFLSHYLSDHLYIFKRTEIISVPIQKKEIQIIKENPKIIIQQEIQKPIFKELKEIEYPVIIDDDKKEEYDPIYYLYR